MKLLSVLHVLCVILSCHFSTLGLPISSFKTTAKMSTYSSVSLPKQLIVGYANWNECDDKIVTAVEQGVNVVIWFAINLSVDKFGSPTITNGPDWDCVADKVSKIRKMGLETLHLISIGGWNSPHPDVSNPAERVYDHWNKWNREIAARPELGFTGFDGFDWDIEGNDDVNSEYNEFTPACLDLMGRFSQLAKRDGYIVSMAPAESYLDPITAPAFDRSLRHEYTEWETVLSAPFPYHGRNCYAYLLARYGESPLRDGQTAETFDFITIQLYEGYSHVQYQVVIEEKAPDQALVDFCTRVTQDWVVDFSSDMDLQYPHTAHLRIAPERLVVGLANGWAGDGKFLLVYPEAVESAYEKLQMQHNAPRGFAFWNILDEDKASVAHPQLPVNMATGLNKFLHIR